MPVTRNSGWPGKNQPALGGSSGSNRSGAGESWGADRGPAGVEEELLGQITRFMQRKGLSDGDYGRLIKDHHFLRRLRGGGWPRASNIARQRAIMAAYDRKSRS